VTRGTACTRLSVLVVIVKQSLVDGLIHLRLVRLRVVGPLGAQGLKRRCRQQQLEANESEPKTLGREVRTAASSKKAPMSRLSAGCAIC